MPDDTERNSSLHRILYAYDASQIVAIGQPVQASMMPPWEDHRHWGGPRIGWVDGAYADFRKTQDRAALEHKLVGLGELKRAKMAARLARETALNRDAACSTAAALHQIGKGVDWFVKMIPATSTYTASRAVIGLANFNALMLAYDRARSQAVVIKAVLSTCIDVSDDRLEIELPSTGGSFPGLFDSPPCRGYSRTVVQGSSELVAPQPDEPRQPSYLQHDPTKRVKDNRRGRNPVRPRWRRY